MKNLYLIQLLVFQLFSFSCLGGPYDPIVTQDYGDGTSATYDGHNIISSTQTIDNYTNTYYYDNQE